MFMNSDLLQAAMTTWAAKDLPARLLAVQVGKLLNCSVEDVGILVSSGKLRPSGRPNTNAVKFFSAVELMALLADRDGWTKRPKPLATSGSERMHAVMVSREKTCRIRLLWFVKFLPDKKVRFPSPTPFSLLISETNAYVSF